jgi:hypothetical protein
MIDILKLIDEAKKYDHPLFIMIMMLEDDAAKNPKQEP